MATNYSFCVVQLVRVHSHAAEIFKTVLFILLKVVENHVHSAEPPKRLSVGKFLQQIY